MAKMRVRMVSGHVWEGSERSGESMIAGADGEFVSREAHVDPDPALWRFEFVDDSGPDSLQVAIDGLRVLRDALNSETPEALAARVENNACLANGQFSEPREYRVIVRWLLRLGYWLKSDQQLTATERLADWLRSPVSYMVDQFGECFPDDDDGRIEVRATGCQEECCRSPEEGIEHALALLLNCRKAVPCAPPQPENALEWLPLFRAWIINIESSPPFGMTEIRDIPEHVPIDPWSAFRKWQYYSDASFLVTWFWRTLDLQAPAKLLEKLCSAAATPEIPFIGISRERWNRIAKLRASCWLVLGADDELRDEMNQALDNSPLPVLFKRMSLWLEDVVSKLLCSNSVVKTPARIQGDIPLNLKTDIAEKQTVGEQISPGAQAVAIMYEHFKRTGKLMGAKAVGKAIGVVRSTLYTWKEFTDTRQAIQAQLKNSGTVPKGHRTRSGDIEAYRDDD